MKTLFIDTSTQVLILAFIENDKIIYREELQGKNNHSDHLINKITEGLAKTNYQVKDFDRIIVGIGPGLYTGLRVSLTVAKTFSWTANIPLYTISSLLVLASGYFNKPGKYIIKTHAKKGYVYTTVINVLDIVDILETDAFISFDDLEVLINKYPDAKLIEEENYIFNPLIIENSLITKIEDVNLVEPNYLRGEL
jgi:tRNA threonylcarbamoyladenosine biosynthesis protein TsaB